jgi:hypothetical protein
MYVGFAREMRIKIHPDKLQVLTLKLRRTTDFTATETITTKHGSTPPFSYIKKKMDTLLLGIYNVVPCCVLWVPGRVSTGT